LFRVRALESSAIRDLSSPHVLSNAIRLLTLGLLVTAIGLAGVGRSYAQEETTRGKIAGTIRNQAGAPIAGAKVQIISKVRDVHYDLVTDAKGHYESTWLQEANYTVRIEARNFLVDLFVLPVKIGQVANGDRTLSPINPGDAVLASTVKVDAIADLPVDGREAVNATKFEAEVAVEDGGKLEPTRTGNFAASIDKISGLDSRYTLDGVDYNDETKGGVTQNIGLGSISSAVVTRSMGEVSQGLTSSGTVALTTHEGGKGYHGEAWGFFRDSGAGFADSPGGVDPHYQRPDFGGKFGGRLLSDKLYFFVDAERQHQDAQRAVVAPTPFQTLAGSFFSPYRNTSGSGRLDLKLSDAVHAFYRFAYNLNTAVDNFGQGYAAFDSRSNAPSHAVGLDWTRGQDIHSFRFGYLHYHNSLQGATITSPGIPQLGVNLRFTDLDGGAVQFGPSTVAPQETFQNNLEFRYDGTHRSGSQTLYFGGSVNRITSGGYQDYYGLAPQITSAAGTSLDANPLDYPVLAATLSNGQGFATEHSGFGFPQGGLSSTRLQGYLGGAYRMFPNLTITFGVHYVRDGGRTDGDLPVVGCSEIVPTLPDGTAPCTGTQNLIDQFGFLPGLGAQVRTPNMNFGPQFGLAWDPYRNGRILIRGGGAVFYDTSLLSNVRYDRSVRLQQGLYSATNVLSCSPGAAPGTVAVNFPTPGGATQAVTSIDNLDLATQVCGQPAGAVEGNVADLQAAYQAAVAATGAVGNPNFVGRTLAVSTPFNNLAAFESNYRTPRSYQMSIGVQRETWRGGVITVDYVRNVSQHFEMIQDLNHVGDWNYLNTNAALNAITRTINAKAPACLSGIPLVTAGAISQTAVSCYIAAVPGASINDFAVNGLDSGVAYLGGLPASVARGVGPDQGAAFPGVNPLVGQGMFMTSVGQAVYNGMQAELKQSLDRPFFAFNTEDFQLAYTYSKFVTSGGDNLSGSAVGYDFQQAALYKGPAPLDRRQRITFAGALKTRWGPRILLAGAFASPAPTILTMGVPSGNPLATPGEIFRTDFRGDGTPGDIFPPKTSAGSFEPPTGSSLASAISTYNNTQAGHVTPAGSALVTAQIVTASQLTTLQGVKPYVVLPPNGQVTNPWLKSFDAAVSWPLRVGESLIIEPRVTLYNVLNFANFDPLVGQLGYYFPSAFQPQSGGVGSANGTPAGAAHDVLRTNFGSGVYNAGAPRQMEFGVKITF
jgi:hypothetical protein